MSSVPLHRVPKIAPSCRHCGSERHKIIMSQAFAPGYHRRHICVDCGGAYYTLADYLDGSFQTSFSPFKDREMSPWEREQRLQWAKEDVPVTTRVTKPMATEFVETINEVLNKQTLGLELNTKELKLAVAIAALEIDWDEHD